MDVLGRDGQPGPVGEIGPIVIFWVYVSKIALRWIFMYIYTLRVQLVH